MKKTDYSDLKMERVNYKSLNPKQQESFNFQKVSGILADFGYFTMKLSDDWESADFIAMHYRDKSFLKVQLKGRITFDEKYRNKDLFICFEDKTTLTWYLYPHDELCDKFAQSRNFKNTTSWIKNGMYSFSKLSKNDIAELENYSIKDTWNAERERRGDNGFTFEETDEQSDFMMYHTIKQVLESGWTMESVLKNFSQTEESIKALFIKFETIPEDAIFS